MRGFLSIIIELEHRIYAYALARLRSQRANLIVTSVSAQATSENAAPTAPTYEMPTLLDRKSTRLNSSH